MRLLESGILSNHLNPYYYYYPTTYPTPLTPNIYLHTRSIQLKENLRHHMRGFGWLSSLVLIRSRDIGEVFANVALAVYDMI